MSNRENVKLLYIDLFCGAGGTSTGVEQARLHGNKCAKVIACVNHDKNAIASHKANHPDVLHMTEDIRTLDLMPLVSHAIDMHDKYPFAKFVLWASLECTNFSRAKGGMPRDADSRTLAEHLFRYIKALQPDYIQIENVEEFMCWGDLDENGKPVSKEQGRCYMRWLKKIKSYGYDFDYRILNSADYGAYTSRKRYFGIFAKRGLPIVFPEPTHSRRGGKDLFNTFEKWRPVKEVLDLENDGDSIFTRKKPLVEKTLERIYAGLVKFVAGGKDEFLLRYNTARPQDTVKSTDEPCGVLTCENRFAKTKVQFLSKQFSGDPYGKNISIEQPAGSPTCRDHHAFITAYYGNGFNTSVEEPANTVTTSDRFALITSKFIDSQYGNGYQSSIKEPSPTVTSNPKQNIVTAEHFLMNPQFDSAGGSIDKPCFTLIARMDKMPPYLITTDKGVGIKIFDTDSPMTVRIKEFMALYGIIDIKMRMLNISELKRIMGFPDNYVLIGTQAEQKKYIGNAVEVNMSRVICEALCEELTKVKSKAI